jgi:hypothetical protein
MVVALDLFAEANPAFTTFVAVNFCRSFVEASGQAPHIALTYLAVPIAMSDDTQPSFEKTNAKTGLLAWITRYPDVRLNIGARLDASVPIVSAGIKLAVMTRALTLEVGGRLALGQDVPPKAVNEKLPAQPKQVLRRANRLGMWMATAGTPAAIFSIFGVTP